MKIATFNINNINKRLANLLAWLRSAKPDVVALQELKAADAEAHGACRGSLQGRNPGGACRRLQRRANGSRYLSDQVLCQRRAASAGKPSAVSAHSRSRLGRRDPGPASRRADVYVLGLHAKPMGAGCRAAHRPLAAERTSGGAADRCRRRS